MLDILQADLLKLKRKWFWLLVFLGPFGVVSLQIVNYGVRYDWLIQQQPDVWLGLIQNINMFVAPALLLGMTILASQIANIEHQQSSWKQLLSLPVRRRDVFSSKFIIVFFMLLLSCALLFVGTIILGVYLHFGDDIPLLLIFKNSFYPLLAGIPILAIQLWLSITIQNQAYSLSVGILGSVCSMYAYSAPDWFIWKWPLLQAGQGQEKFLLAGVLAGSVILLGGIIDFQRKDVK